MRTRHRLRVTPVPKTIPIPDFPGANTSAGSAPNHTGADQEAREVEQLCQSLATISASDRHTLIEYFGRVARYIAAVKLDSGESDPTHP
jgi:hypothetical protein